MESKNIDYDYTFLKIEFLIIRNVHHYVSCPVVETTGYIEKTDIKNIACGFNRMESKNIDYDYKFLKIQYLIVRNVHHYVSLSPVVETTGYIKKQI